MRRNTMQRGSLQRAKHALRGILLIVLSQGGALLHAQIGIGTTHPHPSSMLDINAGPGNNRGFILPTMSSSSRIVLDSTQNIGFGTIVFDTDLQKFYFFGQSPRTWREVDADWIRKDVAGASPVIGSNIYLGVSGNVGVGTPSTPAPNAKLSVVGNMMVGSAAYVLANTPPDATSLVVQHWLGVNTATRTTSNTAEKLRVRGDARITGDVNAGGVVTTARFFGEGMAAPGTVRMWSDIYLPSGSGFNGLGEGFGIMQGWGLCDGRNGRPDLRGRFVVGMTNMLGNGPDYNNTERNNLDYNSILSNNHGGKDSVQLTIPQMPTHNHSGSTTSGGSHRHTYEMMDDYEGYVLAGNSSAEVFQWGDYGWTSTSNDGSHSHDLSIDDEGLGKKRENLPPYYVVAYIVKLP